MKRRTLLIAGGSSLALLGLGVWSLRPFHVLPAAASVQLEDLARSMRGSTAVGRAFLEHNRDLDLKRLLFARLELQRSDSITQPELIERLQAAVRQDFQTGRIINAESNWLLSETEVWLAALQIRLLDDEAPGPADIGFEFSRVGEFLDVVDFAPRQVTVGQPLQHPDLADNVMWFNVAEAPAHLQIFINDQRILPSVNPRGFSVRISRRLLESLWSEPGRHAIWAYEPAAQLRQTIAYLIVVDGARAELEGFCRVGAWGEQHTRAGEAFNVQPDGSSAFWIRIGCAPEDTVVMLGSQALPTTVRLAEGLITARVDDPALYAQPGELELRLVSAALEAEMDVGAFAVRP